MLHPHVVVRYDQYSCPVREGSILRVQFPLQRSVQQLLLEQDERLHGVRESLLVAPKQTQHSAYVEVRVRRVRPPLVQRVLYVQRFLEVLQGAPYLAQSPLLARHVVARDSLTLLAVLRQHLCLLQQIERHREVLFVHVRHRKQITEFAQLHGSCFHLF